LTLNFFYAIIKTGGKSMKFISYDGEYPNLCYGTLVIEVDSREYSMENCLITSGSVCWENGEVRKGEWYINEYYLPEELLPYIEEITRLVNDNVEWGCCGGCL
jgi:hypothetical protein